LKRFLRQLSERYESSSSAPRTDASQPEALKDQAVQSDQSAQAKIPATAKQKRKRKPQANEPQIDLGGYLQRIWPARPRNT
jgi:hypothetical protein